MEGIRRFLYGLGKKVLIANVLGQCVDSIYAMELSEVTGAFAWLAAGMYMLQIYYDFSGYSDMAIGLGKLFGFDFPENFNYPYLSKSVQELDVYKRQVLIRKIYPISCSWYLMQRAIR